jgi:hypothetical protein
MLQTARYLMISGSSCIWLACPQLGQHRCEIFISAPNIEKCSHKLATFRIHISICSGVLANHTIGNILDQCMAVGQCCSEADSSKLRYEGTLNIFLTTVIYIGLFYTNSIHVFVICFHSKFHIPTSNGPLIIPIESRVNLRVSCDHVIYVLQKYDLKISVFSSAPNFRTL